MAMRYLDDNQFTVAILITEPVPKIKNRNTGEPAKDHETNATIFVADVTVVVDGRADVMPVQVPEPGLGEGLHVGAMVAFTGLRMNAWTMQDDSGQHRCGVSYRAAALTVKAA